MKKFFMMAAVAAMTAMSFTACNGGGSPKLNDEVDTLAYDFGIAQSEGLKQYMSMQLGVDSAYIDEFIKGMKEGAINEADPKKEAYMQGINVGKQIQNMQKGISEKVYAGDSSKTVNINLILKGLIDGLKGKSNMTSQEAGAKFQELFDKIDRQNMEKMYGEYKAQNEEYLAKNAKAEGVQVLPSGVQYKVLVAGDGAVPSDTASIQVNYEGKTIDGNIFDSSYDRNQPLPINMANPGVIPGWVEILKIMPAGSTWEVTIPAELAYGAQDMGKIKPYSTLIFKIEMLK